MGRLSLRLIILAVPARKSLDFVLGNNARNFLKLNWYLLDILGERGLRLSKTVGFDRLNQLRRAFLRRYMN
jgi:hypothetical protein